ncbi:YojF family protein [Bacillus sp. CGMCC 1.16541]|uniref:YojF family protein n=1 Tax=Bacillus sp. CGMCC 1.16541 TaxID=2185143 RepID=UPI000D73C2CB|nr:YojF family protein [Bacillus sp. CGMCC 1.16541]
MQPIEKKSVQQHLTNFFNKEVYVHLETTNGAYASHFNEKVMTVGAFIRNAKVHIKQGKITGDSPYRVGLEMPIGWVYAEGLTDWEINDQGQLLLAGHDFEGRLAVALQISETPFA